MGDRICGYCGKNFDSDIRINPKSIDYVSFSLTTGYNKNLVDYKLFHYLCEKCFDYTKIEFDNFLKKIVTCEDLNDEKK